jgi:hypothetical protein
MITNLPSRRGATRRDVAIPCQIIRKADFTLIADRTLDLSMDGALVPVTRTLAVGEEVIVSFAIPGAWVDVEGVVARVVHARRPGDDGLALGIFFGAVEPSMRSALALFLHGKPPPLPRRGPLARLRRGLPAPVLADQDIMATALPDRAPLADEKDVIEDDEIDPAAILRALVGAWQSLSVAE